MSDNRNRGQNQKKHRNEKETIKVINPEDISPTMRLFQTYQTELDLKYDKHERLIKKSRDLTIESKRIIFLLHRVTSSGNKAGILKEAEDRLSSLFTNVINEIALELNKREVYQYIKAFTAGLQEFVEAVSFYHYIKNGSLITLDEVYNPDFIVLSSEVSENELQKERIKAELPLSDLLAPIDYVLGIGDLTGELMRKCINSVGAGDMDEPFKLCFLLQSIYDGLLVCTNHSKELKRKVYTLKSSLQKVENACYAIKIRGTETPKHMLADFFSTDDDYKDSGDCDM